MEGYSSPDFWEFIPTAAKALLGSVAGAWIQILAAAIAWVALQTHASVNLRNKRIDVIINCNARYDEIYKQKIAILKDIEENRRNGRLPHSAKRAIRNEVGLYFRRYWGLKSDQIDYWLAGYVDPETLISWFMSTIDAVGDKGDYWPDFSDFADGGWRHVKSSHETTNEILVNVIDIISTTSIQRMNNDDRYAALFMFFDRIEKEENPLIKFLARNHHKRLSHQEFYRLLSAPVAQMVDSTQWNRKPFRKAIQFIRRVRIYLAYEGTKDKT